jgi:3-hydroxyacyl-[acyl-carrier-protein] dehydratase
VKLFNDFFKVLESSVSVSGFHTTIALNPAHIVYTGHFPGYPVTPGVIQLQIVHELLENHFGRKLKLTDMPNCKFLKVLNPVETSQFIVHIEYT